MNTDSVHIARAWDEFNSLHDLAGADVIFDETGRIARIIRSSFLLMAGHLPDEAIIIFDPMQSFRQARYSRTREFVIDFPGFRIDTDDRFEPVRIDPDLAPLTLPGHAVRRAAVILWAKWNLAMADFLAVHVGLENAIDRWIRMVDFGAAVGSAPNVSVAEAHTACILGVRHNGMEQLATPIQQPGSLLFIVVPLLLNPKAPFLAVVDAYCVRPTRRREK